MYEITKNSIVTDELLSPVMERIKFFFYYRQGLPGYYRIMKFLCRREIAGGIVTRVLRPRPCLVFSSCSCFNQVTKFFLILSNPWARSQRVQSGRSGGSRLGTWASKSYPLVIYFSIHIPQTKLKVKSQPWHQVGIQSRLCSTTKIEEQEYGRNHDATMRNGWLKTKENANHRNPVCKRDESLMRRVDRKPISKVVLNFYSLTFINWDCLYPPSLHSTGTQKIPTAYPSTDCYVSILIPQE